MRAMPDPLRLAAVAEPTEKYGREDVGKLRTLMRLAAENLEFEKAARLRDRIKELELN